MMQLSGKRNLLIAGGYFALLAWFGYLAPDQIPGMAATATGIGVGTAGIVFGRGYNKAAENGKK